MLDLCLVVCIILSCVCLCAKVPPPKLSLLVSRAWHCSSKYHFNVSSMARCGPHSNPTPYDGQQEHYHLHYCRGFVPNGEASVSRIQWTTIKFKFLWMLFYRKKFLLCCQWSFNVHEGKSCQPRFEWILVLFQFNYFLLHPTFPIFLYEILVYSPIRRQGT